MIAATKVIEKKTGNYLLVGGNSGIGHFVASKLFEAGNSVLSMSRNPLYVGDWEHLVVDITEEYPAFPKMDAPLDGLIYCPGTITLKPFKSMKIDDFRREMEVNYFGLVKTLQKYYGVLKKGENPSVVVFSTIAVQKGMAFHSSISAAKGAVEGLVRSLAAEWAPSIRINAIAPSLVETPLASSLLRNQRQREAAAQRHPLKRIGNPGDVGNLVEFLLSHESGWITGQVFGVDGGLSM
jgi:NAD(P)-dependent dehydrogenase (short-subunit alcohol dehydrogenase family)